MPIVIVQNWEERERGWGSRPDGFTVSLTVADTHAHVAWYVKKYHTAPTVPDDYSAPSSEPFPVDADDDVYAALVKHKQANPGSHVVWGAGSHWSRSQDKVLTRVDVRLPEPEPEPKPVPASVKTKTGRTPKAKRKS